jgi:hypothetical protein
MQGFVPGRVFFWFAKKIIHVCASEITSERVRNVWTSMREEIVKGFEVGFVLPLDISELMNTGFVKH